MNEKPKDIEDLIAKEEMAQRLERANYDLIRRRIDFFRGLPIRVLPTGEIIIPSEGKGVLEMLILNDLPILLQKVQKDN